MGIRDSLKTLCAQTNYATLSNLIFLTQWYSKNFYLRLFGRMWVPYLSTILTKTHKGAWNEIGSFRTHMKGHSRSKLIF